MEGKMDLQIICNQKQNVPLKKECKFCHKHIYLDKTTNKTFCCYCGDLD